MEECALDVEISPVVVRYLGILWIESSGADRFQHDKVALSVSCQVGWFFAEIGRAIESSIIAANFWLQQFRTETFVDLGTIESPVFWQVKGNIDVVNSVPLFTQNATPSPHCYSCHSPFLCWRLHTTMQWWRVCCWLSRNSSVDCQWNWNFVFLHGNSIELPDDSSSNELQGVVSIFFN